MRTIPDIRPRVDSIPLADPRIDAGKASGVKAKSRPLNRLEGDRQYILHGDQIRISPLEPVSMGMRQLENKRIIRCLTLTH